MKGMILFVSINTKLYFQRVLLNVEAGEVVVAIDDDVEFSADVVPLVGGDGVIVWSKA